MSIESPEHRQKQDIKTPSKTEAARAVFPDTADREGFTKGQKIAGTVLALGLLGGGVAGANYLSSQHETVATAPADENEGGQAPIATQPVEVSPSAMPTNLTPLETASPTAEAPAVGNPEHKLVASEFDITEAEYAALVDSYKIDVASHPTAESAVQAFNEKMTSFFNAGNTAEDRTEHMEWSHPTDSTLNPGWNSWATQLNLRAIQDALFITDYKSTANSYLPSMEESKKTTNRLWVNSLKANETAYKVNYEFTPTGFAKLSNGNFTAYGSVTFTDNAREIPSASNDSGAAFEKTFENQSVTAVIQDGEWRIHELAVK